MSVQKSLPRIIESAHLFSVLGEQPSDVIGILPAKDLSFLISQDSNDLRSKK